MLGEYALVLAKVSKKRAVLVFFFFYTFVMVRWNFGALMVILLHIIFMKREIL